MSALLERAQVHSDAEPGSGEWLHARRQGITATDIPKILGLSPYGNALSVWADKLGLVEPEPVGEAAEWGSILEGPVAQRWAARRGVAVQRAASILVDPQQPWRLASIDYVPSECPDGDNEPCTVEVKTRSAWTASQWGAEVPDDVLAQTHWQMLVTGTGHVHVAALIGGQTSADHRVDIDASVAAYIAGEAEALWRKVLDRQQPEADHTELLTRVLDAMHPDRSGVAYPDPAKALAAVAGYRAACTAAKAAETAKTAAKARLVELLGDADTAAIRLPDGTEQVAWTYRASQRRGYAVAPTTVRRLNVPKETPDDE